MDPEEAIEAVKRTCYDIVETIGDKGIFLDLENAPEGTDEAYNNLLIDKVKQSFPGIRDNVDGVPIVHRIGHVIHWIIFEAGVEISNERYIQSENGDGWEIVRTDDFDPDLLETGINRYASHIRNLASYID